MSWINIVLLAIVILLVAFGWVYSEFYTDGGSDDCGGSNSIDDFFD